MNGRRDGESARPGALETVTTTSSTPCEITTRGGERLTPLQAAWLPLREAVDDARRELDAETFVVFVAMMTTVVTKLNGEGIDGEWRRAA